MTFDLQIPMIALSAHGGTRILVAFANRAAARGHKVRILLPRGHSTGTYRVSASVTVRELSVRTGNRYLDYLIFLLVCPFYLRSGILVANFFVTYFPVLVAGIVFRRPHIYFVQGIESWYRGPAAILNPLCELTYKSHRIVTANRYLAGRIEERGTRPLAGIDIGPEEAFITLPAASDAKTHDLVIFPRHEPAKRADRLERVIELYRRRHGTLRVLALSQNQAMLARFAALNAELLRPIDQAELIRAIDSAKVMLFTSDHEGFGLPPLECMARGLPAVVYACGGPSVYMRNEENGFVIAPDDDEAAVAALARLLGERECYARMAAAALDTGRIFSLDKALDRLVDIALAQSASRR